MHQTIFKLAFVENIVLLKINLALSVPLFLFVHSASENYLFLIIYKAKFIAPTMSLIVQIFALKLDDSFIGLDYKYTRTIPQIFSERALEVSALMKELAWSVSLSSINPTLKFVTVWKMD